MGGEGEEEEEKKCPRDPIEWLMEKTIPSAEDHYWIVFTISILLIGLWTFVMVDACDRIGCILNVSDLVMGLIFLAAGTSVPDALGSIAVAKQGEGDMAVANALGSNVFDIMLGLGVPWTIKNGFLGGDIVFAGAKDELVKYVIILTAVLFVFIGSLIINKWTLDKRMGAVLIGFYVIYVIYTMVTALIG